MSLLHITNVICNETIRGNSLEPEGGMIHYTKFISLRVTLSPDIENLNEKGVVASEDQVADTNYDTFNHVFVA